MALQASPAKWHRLCSLGDEQGRLRMMAIDQRGSLAEAIARAANKRVEEVSFEELAMAKEIVTSALAPYATAVLTDPVHGYPCSSQHLPPGVALLLAHDETGYQGAGRQGTERRTRLIGGWSVERAQRAGADAVKLRIFYRADVSDDVRGHQQELARRVGQECERADMPFLLEVVGYAIEGASPDTPQFASGKPGMVIEGAAEFSKPRYKVDILKLEFPADLKYTSEFAQGAFDGTAREAVYTLREVRQYCRALNDATGVPWVVVGAGVDFKQFLVELHLATEAGASGFVCGQTIWKEAIDLFPSVERMGEWLRTHGAYNFLRANAHTHRARPWFDHTRQMSIAA